MRRHSAKGLYRKGFWDLGGTLNELSPPSELPENDVLECLNWRVHKDGKSREKRPGYSKLLTVPDVSVVDEEPALKIHEHTDPNNFKNLFAITSKRITMRKDVVTYGRKYLENVTVPNSGGMWSFHYASINFGGKLVIWDATDTGGRALYTEDGETWAELFTSTWGDGNGDGVCMAWFNGNLFMGLYETGGGDPRCLEWDGASITEHNISSQYHCVNLGIWDGKLWALMFMNPYDWKVHYFDGTNWSSIDDYDGNANIDYNSVQHLDHIHNRIGNFFIYGNELYLIVTVYSSSLSDWTWQVWKFNAATYDKFEKIYDSADDSEKYAFSGVINYKGRIYVIGSKLGAQGKPDGNQQRLYVSEDMITWEVENSSITMGFPLAEIVYDERIYVLTHWETDYKNKLWYYDRSINNFVLEKTFSDNLYGVNVGGGLLIDYKTDLYAGKYKEVHKRAVDSTSWSTIYYFKEPIEDPPDIIVFEDRLIISTPDENIMIEGDTVRSLGIIAPTTAPTAAAGDAGILTGDYSYVVTFYRRGNYPCESNPSPVSNTVTFASKKGNLTGIPVSADPKVDTRRIYRTKADGAIYYWLVDIEDNSTTTLTGKNYHDDELGDEVSYDRLPPPPGKYYEVWDNRLWIAGNKEYPNLLYYTNTGTAEEYGDNFLPIARREAEIINQIKAFGDKLYAFKRSSRHVVEKAGDNYFLVTQIDQRIGTDASWSVAVCDRFLIWKSEYGIEVFNGDTCFRPVVSEFIRRTMATINPEKLNRCIGGHNMVDGEYWLNVPTGSSVHPDTTIIFDYLRKKFTIYKFDEDLGFLLNQKTYAEGLRTLIATPDGNIHIWADGWKDDTAVVSANFKTGWLYISGDRMAWNILRRMFIKYILPADKTITMKIYRNFKKTAFATISLPGSTPTTIPELRNEIMKKINLGVRGYYVLFEFINNEDTGGECRIIGWDGYFKKRVWKRTVKAD